MNRVKEEIHMKEYIKSNWKFLLFVLCYGGLGLCLAGCIENTELAMQGSLMDLLI